MAVSQNKETAAILVSQINPLGIELYFYANVVFCFSKLIWLLVTCVQNALFFEEGSRYKVHRQSKKRIVGMFNFIQSRLSILGKSEKTARNIH